MKAGGAGFPQVSYYFASSVARSQALTFTLSPSWREGMQKYMPLLDRGGHKKCQKIPQLFSFPLCPASGETTETKPQSTKFY